MDKSTEKKLHNQKR